MMMLVTLRSVLSRRFVIVTVSAALLLLGYWNLPRIEYRRIESPDGKFTAIATSPLWAGFVPMMPGASGDKPGRIEIIGNDGCHYGSVEVEMVQSIGDLEWTANGASIPVVHDWHLK
jgi:hypothetical protein